MIAGEHIEALLATARGGSAAELAAALRHVGPSDELVANTQLLRLFALPSGVPDAPPGERAAKHRALTAWRTERRLDF